MHNSEGTAAADISDFQVIAEAVETPVAGEWNFYVSYQEEDYKRSNLISEPSCETYD